MNEIIVSIICTNYNKGNWIGEAIESFLHQETSFKYEILLIDDASTDNSDDIIREYANKYPDIIHAFYNKKNLGITKTWIKACQQAKGKYIARCDGDDYWIDDNKLQKQVDILEKSKQSKWCSTDYDLITPEGELIHRSAFEQGLVKRSESYAEMLVTKGFTMASTWLVDTKLMRDINDELDKNAVDDTFNIQLDLFNKTQLTYLPKATVVYRGNEGSDSRPVGMDKIKLRNKRLLKTQLEYIEKYKDTEYEDIIKRLLKQNMHFELLAIERLQIIHELWDRAKITDQEIKNRDKQISDILNSRTYKAGHLIASPLSVLKSIPARLKRQ